jgi:hypothetical protein
MNAVSSTPQRARGAPAPREHHDCGRTAAPARNAYRPIMSPRKTSARSGRREPVRALPQRPRTPARRPSTPIPPRRDQRRCRKQHCRGRPSRSRPSRRRADRTIASPNIRFTSQHHAARVCGERRQIERSHCRRIERRAVRRPHPRPSGERHSGKRRWIIASRTPPAREP